MSYCRFSEGDVYAYECAEGVQFYVPHDKRELDRTCSTFNEAYQYAKRLRDVHGLDVPSHAIETLKADAIEDAISRFGPDSAVAELKDENAGLRELVKDMWPFIEDQCPRECCLFEECDASSDRECHIEEHMAARMRELGIEVD